MVLKIDSDNARENDKSDFMDEIRKEIELKAILKKSVGPFYQDGQKTSLFH